MNNTKFKYLDLNIYEILENWELWQAIREIIANAIDEHMILSLKKEIICNYNDQNNSIIIRDFGRGIESKNFVQNENSEKTNQDTLIGKFGIGLKDAIATLHRNKKYIEINSKNGHWTPVLRLKEGSTRIETIQMKESPPRNALLIGTEIIIGDIPKNHYNKAKNQFLIFNNYEKLDSNENGDIYKANLECKEIYINGMKVGEDIGFLFSYNIKKLNKKLKRSLNRERTTISRDSYRECIINILKKTNIENLKKIRNEKSDEYLFTEIKLLTLKKLGILPATQSVVDNDPAFSQYLRENEREYEIVTEKEYASLKRGGLETLSDFGEEFINDFSPEEINILTLSKEQRKIFENSINFINKYKLNKKRCRISLIKSHPNATGIYKQNSNLISIVAKQTKNYEKFLGVLLHELAHSYNNYKDGTIDFENELTNLLGIVSYKIILDNGPKNNLISRFFRIKKY